MVEVTIEGRSPNAKFYLKKRDGICRLLQLALLVAVEGCLGYAVSIGSQRGFFHLIIAAIPIASIFCVIAAHLMLGPYEAWPRCRRCSWPRMESAHDLIVFVLLLPGALILLVPPFTVFEVTAGVLTLVTVVLVTLHAVENLQRARNRSATPLRPAEGSRDDGISLMRRPRRENSLNPPDVVSPQRYSSTPLHVYQSPQGESVIWASSKSPENMGCNSRRQCSNPASPLKVSPIGRVHRIEIGNPVSPSSPSTVHPRVNILRNSHEISNFEKRDPVLLSSVNEGRFCFPLNTNAEMLPSNPEAPNSSFICEPNLRLFHNNLEVGESNACDNRNANLSVKCLPIIKLTKPTPVTVSALGNRVKEREIGASPLLQDKRVMCPQIAKHSNPEPPVFNHTTLSSFENSEPVFAMCSVDHNQDMCNKERDSHDPLTDKFMYGEELELSRPVIAELNKRFNTNTSSRPLTSLKSLEEFSPPKTFFSDSTRQPLFDSPLPAPRTVTALKSAPLPFSNSSLTTRSSPIPLPRQSQDVISPKPVLSIPVLPREYIPVYPNVKSFQKNLRTSQSLPNSYPRSQDSAGEQLISPTSEIPTEVSSHKKNIIRISSSVELQNTSNINQHAPVSSIVSTTSPVLHCNENSSFVTRQSEQVTEL